MLKRKLLLGAACLAIACATPAQAMPTPSSWQFTMHHLRHTFEYWSPPMDPTGQLVVQDMGYQDISGSFSAFDANGNGIIERAELWSLDFDHGTIHYDLFFPGFNDATVSDFQFSQGTGLRIQADVMGWAFATGPGGTSYVESSPAATQRWQSDSTSSIGVVPEPTTTALLLPGLAWLGAMQHRRRRHPPRC